ncbi:MAG: DUF554 domain-containing protein [Clostridia bacterium]|nr:DUF554 domain-containing protein [Clostridia bacterium]
MIGLGTIVNVLAVVLGGVLGMLFKRGIKERFREIMVQACGLAVMFIGGAGALEMMLTVEGSKVSAGATMLLVFSLAIGGLAGEALNIEKKLDFVGDRLRSAVKAKGDNRFVDGFVTASLVTCVGAMAIVGPMNEALTGAHETLFVKSILDFVILIVFGSVYGLGAVFSAVVIGVYQGGITLFAKFISDYMTPSLIANMSGVGSVLIFAVGLNLIFPKKVRVGNLLPALLVPVLYELLLKIPYVSSILG